MVAHPALGPDKTWGPHEIGDLTGRTALVTGANSGIGFETAFELAAHGAITVLACRDEHEAAEARDRIVAHVPAGLVETLPLDLANLSSVRAAADRFATLHDRLDVLVNNAGIMATPQLSSADGHELQFATNHLGHFALTGLLLDHLLTTPEARVVTVSSLIHRIGRLGPDPAHPPRYHRWRAYAASKLANLLFTFELARRLAQIRADALSAAAHPGWTRTQPAASGPMMGRPALQQRIGRLVVRHLGQPSNTGALPVLYAATAPQVRNGDFFGPGGFSELTGPPAPAKSSPASRQHGLATRLWEQSESLSGVAYHFDPPSPRSSATPAHPGSIDSRSTTASRPAAASP